MSEAEIKLQEEIIADITAEIGTEATFNLTALQCKTANAIREVKAARRYPSYYTDAQKDEDVQKYYANIRNIALYDYSKIGADFQDKHDELSSTQTWIDRNKLFFGVLPLSGV